MSCIASWVHVPLFSTATYAALSVQRLLEGDFRTSLSKRRNFDGEAVPHKLIYLRSGRRTVQHAAQDVFLITAGALLFRLSRTRLLQPGVTRALNWLKARSPAVTLAKFVNNRSCLAKVAGTLSAQTTQLFTWCTSSKLRVAGSSAACVTSGFVFLITQLIGTSPLVMPVPRQKRSLGNQF